MSNEAAPPVGVGARGVKPRDQGGPVSYSAAPQATGHRAPQRLAWTAKAQATGAVL